MLGWYADIFVEFLVRVVMRMVRVFSSRSWPPLTGEVTASNYQEAGYGCDVAEICYKYRVDGELYTGVYVNPFISSMRGKEYVARLPVGTELVLRIKPGEPSISVMDRQGSASPALANRQSG
jgi:hypothetical protein